MIDKVTTVADALGLLCLALGIAWFVGDRFGIGWGLLALGALILCMSAVVAEASRRKGGSA